MPDDDEAFGRIAAFLGYAGEEALTAAVRARLELVERHYQQLFGDAPPLSRAGNLVFTGEENDPETMATLQRLGFADPASVAAAVRSWHHGRIRATRSPRARGLLTEILPDLLTALGGTSNPDAAFVRFAEFLARLPTGVQMFSLLSARSELLALVAEILGTAPRLAEHLSRTPTLLDVVLSPEFQAGFPTRAELDVDLAIVLSHAFDFQDVLDLCRRWAREKHFQVGLRVMRGLRAREAGHALSDVADALIQALLPRVAAEFEKDHGRIAEGSFAIVALGKLGAREMTSGSDLDLIFLYDAPSPDAGSTGRRSLSATAYYARLGQRLLAALTAKTAEGGLFDVDLRLRPSGAAGPIAVSLAAFRAYHRERAWTWEHMALTRARIVAGREPFATHVIDSVRAVLAAPRDPERLLCDVADMRARIEREKGTVNLWQVKVVRGGLVDLEFLAQYLLLREAAAVPGLPTGDTAAAFDRLGRAGVLSPALSARLREATLRVRDVQAFLRECFVENLRRRRRPRGTEGSARADGGRAVVRGTARRPCRDRSGGLRRVPGVDRGPRGGAGRRRCECTYERSTFERRGHPRWRSGLKSATRRPM